MIRAYCDRCKSEIPETTQCSMLTLVQHRAVVTPETGLQVQPNPGAVQLGVACDRCAATLYAEAVRILRTALADSADGTDTPPDEKGRKSGGGGG